MIQPPGRDPAQILAERGADYLAEYLAVCTQPLADLVTDTELDRWSRWLPYAEGQVNALRAVAQVIAAMPPSHVGRQVARLASQLALDHAVVTDAVTSALPGSSTAVAPDFATRPGAHRAVRPPDQHRRAAVNTEALSRPTTRDAARKWPRPTPTDADAIDVHRLGDRDLGVAARPGTGDDIRCLGDGRDGHRVIASGSPGSGP